MNILFTQCIKFFSFSKAKVPIILQLSETECGIASLAMIFAYYNLDISFEKLREQCGVSRDGCKAQTLLDVARCYGFNADAYKVDLDEINNLSLPLIAYWNFNHFVVIKKVTSNKVHINDPAHGGLTVSMEDFDKSFTGVVLQITPQKKITRVKKKLELISFLKLWFTGLNIELLYLLLCLLTLGFIPYLNSTLSSVFIDQCLIAKNINWIPSIIFLTILSAGVFILTSLSQKKAQFNINSKAGLFKSSAILVQILQLPMLFYSLRQRSEIISILSRAESIISLILKSTLNLSLNFIKSLLCIIFMMKLNLYLSIITVIMTIASSVIVYYISKINFSYEKSNINVFGKLYSHSLSSIRNIETVKASGLESYTLKRWLNLFINKVQSQDKIAILNVLFLSLTKTYNSLSMLTILCFGGYQVTHGEISIGNLMGFYSLHLIFFNGVSSIFQALRDSQSAYALNTRINDIALSEKDQRFSSLQDNKTCDTNFNECILLSNITFHYNRNSSPVLQNINLKIYAGQHIALVGGTGSGKSSLSKLICGFYQPHVGEIYLLGRKLSSYSGGELAKLCAYVSQDVSLFSGTIQQNLILSNENANLSIINQAINAACLKDLIKHRKLHGIVEEGGRNFSGGEKQRIDLARALIQDTPILILDEATSALDLHTESEVIKNLRDTNKTIIFVAHRLSTIKHCDQIFVLNNGFIVEHGQHQELINNKSYYFSLIENDVNSDKLVIC